MVFNNNNIIIFFLFLCVLFDTMMLHDGKRFTWLMQKSTLKRTHKDNILREVFFLSKPVLFLMTTKCIFWICCPCQMCFHAMALIYEAFYLIRQRLMRTKVYDRTRVLNTQNSIICDNNNNISWEYDTKLLPFCCSGSWFTVLCGFTC